MFEALAFVRLGHRGTTGRTEGRARRWASCEAVAMLFVALWMSVLSA